VLSALGLPALEPDINGITDTSDYEHVTTLVGAIDRRPFRVCVERMCSGYGGRDARAFALRMRVVLGIAGSTQTHRAGVRCSTLLSGSANHEPQRSARAKEVQPRV
jgi:hypothetical protein